MQKVFISHSSNDRPIVEKFVDFLERGLGIERGLIFCSSCDGTDIPIGANFIDFIKRQLNSIEIVIPVITKNYYNSTFSMYELGAAWAISKELMPIIISPMNYSSLRDFLSTTVSVVLAEERDLNKLKDNPKIQKIATREISTTIWEKERNILLQQLVLMTSSNESNIDSFPCLNDPKRRPILDQFKPTLYFPLEDNFLNLASRVSCGTNHTKPACDVNVFPYGNVYGDVIERPDFIEGFGYRFNGQNMISIQTNQHFPYSREARTFIFAIHPTSKPIEAKPMFFFSYGQRKKHECGDGHSNHDKSFGVFWGQPAPEEEIPDEYKGIGVRVFFYCEHCKKDRTSQNCDTKSLYEITELNKWYIFAVAYDGTAIRFYIDGVKIHDQNYSIDTSKTLYLNIGGFVHHNEAGAAIAADLKYSMNGYIREFMMFRQALPSSEISAISNSIKQLIGI